MSEDLDDGTAAAIHAAWEAGESFDEIAARFDVDRKAIRQAVFAGQMAKGGPSAELVPVGGPASSEVVAGEIVAESAAYLPAQYRGEGPPPGATQDVVDNWLSPSAKRLILRGKSPHTIKAYMQGMGWWVRFAKANGITVMPAPQNGMIRLLDWWEQFPVHVGCTGKKQAGGARCTGHRPSPSAVWILYSGVRWFHGLGEPPQPWEGGIKLQSAIAGYIEGLKEDGWRPTSAPRAYPDDVRAMVDALDAMGDEPPAGWDEWGASRDEDEDASKDDEPVWFHPARRDMLRALLLTGFYTGGRASDLARYRVSDIERFPGGIKLTLATSKARRGRRDAEFRTIFTDLANPQYCGTVALERWIARESAAGITSGAIFRPVHKRGMLSRGKADEASYTADVSGLSRAIRMIAKAAWQRSGKTLLLEWRTFTIHSLRRGRVQQLLEEEVDVYDVETELGWAHGGAVKAYREQVARMNQTAANAHGML